MRINLCTSRTSSVCQSGQAHPLCIDTLDPPIRAIQIGQHWTALHPDCELQGRDQGSPGSPRWYREAGLLTDPTSSSTLPRFPRLCLFQGQPFLRRESQQFWPFPTDLFGLPILHSVLSQTLSFLAQIWFSASICLIHLHLPLYSLSTETVLRRTLRSHLPDRSSRTQPTSSPDESHLNQPPQHDYLRHIESLRFVSWLCVAVIPGLSIDNKDNTRLVLRNHTTAEETATLGFWLDASCGWET